LVLVHFPDTVFHFCLGQPQIATPLYPYTPPGITDVHHYTRAWAWAFLKDDFWFFPISKIESLKSIS
jgi:hypothetical protein